MLETISILSVYSFFARDHLFFLVFLVFLFFYFVFMQLGAVDATQAQSLAQKYGVQGYPTIKTFPAGPKKGPQDYNGPREAAGIVDYATGVRACGLVWVLLMLMLMLLTLYNV